MSAVLGGSPRALSFSYNGDDDKLLVLRLEGKEQLGTLPEWHVDLVGNVNLVGARDDLLLDDLVGEQVTVTIAHGTERHINAYVTEAQRGERRGRFNAYRVTLRPWLWFATRNRNCRVFQEEGQTVEQIVSAVLEDYDAPFEFNLSQSHAVLEYCVQYNESDFDFISRLLEEAGIYYFFEHTSSNHKLMMVDGMAGHAAKPGDPVIHWSNKLDAKKASMVEWHASQEVTAAKATVRDFDYLASADPVEGDTPEGDALPLGSGELYEYGSRVVRNQRDTEAEDISDALSRVAQVRLEEQQALKKVYTGTTNCNDLKVGDTFDLSGAPRDDDEATYLVVSMNLSAEFADHEAIEEIAASQGRRDGVLATVMCIRTDGLDYRPGRRTPRPVMYGPQTATVVGASGNEVETDAQGRIKVQFHWDREGNKDENSSCFVRVSQPWAGKGMGLWMLPRVGHEVVVSFIGGDPDRPLITGSVHNDANTPIYPLPGHADISGWRTHSTKEGPEDARHELRFDDKKDSEYVWLQSQKDFRRHVKADAFDWIEQNENRKVKLTRQEVVGENWLMYVGQDVKHDLGKDLHTKVAGDIFTTGAATWQVQLESDFSAKIGADLSYDVTGKTALKSGGDIALQTEGVASLKTGGKLVAESADKLSLKAAADLLLQGANISAKSNGEIVLEASQGLKIVCGSSVITLSASGITIDGAQVKVNCGGGGGSAGAAESAADAEPKAPEEAQNTALLTPDQADDYDALFADPLADEDAGCATASSTPAGEDMLDESSGLRAGALAAGATLLAAAGAAAMAVASGASFASGGDDDEDEASDDGDAAREQALADSEAAERAAREAEARAEAETPRQTAEQALAAAEAAYEAAKAAEAAAITDDERKTAAEVLAVAEAAYEAAKRAEAEANPPGETAEAVQAASDAAYAAAKQAEADAAPPAEPPAGDDRGGAA
jgi:type VI secretion system secreted protein VgrG